MQHLIPSLLSNQVNATSTPHVSASADVSSLLFGILSATGVSDWLKLAVIGGSVELCRRSFFDIWEWLLKSFWITASVDSNDSWILFWISKQPSWNNATRVEVTTSNLGPDSRQAYFSNEEDEDTDRPISYIPSIMVDYSLWYKGRYLTISRTESAEGYYQRKYTLKISIFSRDKAILDQLLTDARTAYKAAGEQFISIYMSDMHSDWTHVTSRPKRPLNSIILDPGIKEMLIDDARDFLDSQEWYFERGIPFRRGYLLYGVPGAGKTSMIHSIAGELGLDVYVLTFSRSGMNDGSLSELISNLPRRCIVLMEDVDAAFQRGIRRRAIPDGQQEPIPESNRPDEKSDGTSDTGITLSGLLNALDGLCAQEGRILFATTNDYNALDPALCRPGRMDLHIEFKLSSKYQVEQLFRCFYSPGKHDAVDEDNSEHTDDEKIDLSQSSRRNSSDLDSASRSESNLLTTSISATALPPEKVVTTTAHPKSGVLSRRRAVELGKRFAGAIPDREFSMASLQGYLMMYKTRPEDAITDAPAWVEKEREARKARTTRRDGSHPSL
ncbi:uncharacterized protein FIBRA_04626 [Fibroporia radiculosa]|uniref:AAA+ ATPase domain-containing protein n=1 Tax=Fibroporia radiculosa TaxID=599839 RepID=J4H323_9APHY|nr:uncharacterized protein FIBRA_04626 [Fibroporia radiculosa]CCM02524.1 predicted protein [Fibroporia radiculosa]